MTHRAQWILTDAIDPEQMRDGSENVEIQQASQLQAILLTFSEGLPREVILTSPDQRQLFISIGPRWAGVRYYPPRGGGMGQVAKASVSVSNSEQWFSAEGQPLGIEPQYLVSPQEAIRIVVYFYETSELAPWLEWEEGD
jgi:hypothetical protein